jgi:hypothetical protein
VKTEQEWLEVWDQSDPSNATSFMALARGIRADALRHAAEIGINMAHEKDSFVSFIARLEAEARKLEEAKQ